MRADRNAKGTCGRWHRTMGLEGDHTRLSPDCGRMTSNPEVTARNHLNVRIADNPGAGAISRGGSNLDAK